MLLPSSSQEHTCTEMCFRVYESPEKKMQFHCLLSFHKHISKAAIELLYTQISNASVYNTLKPVAIISTEALK